jgi:uncharacterized protein YndB with AHSA1/START domain
MSPSSIASSHTEMLIRKPVEFVFNALVDPAITTKFWFTDSSGVLQQDSKVRWTWSMYGISIPVTVLKFDLNRSICIEWGEGSFLSQVEFTFVPVGESGTYVTIRNFDFKGTSEDIIRQVVDSTQGFSLLIAGMKAYLEYGIQLNLVADKSPAIT